MASSDATTQSMLRAYSKAMTHLRRQHEQKRMGLVFGAGLSKPMSFPDWDELVDRISEHPEVDGVNTVKSPKTRDPQSSRTQMLYQRFKSQRYDHEDPKKHYTPELDLVIRRQWRQIVQESLYRDVDLGAAIATKHPYLGSFVDLITTSPLTITYNFDDTIERLLDQERGSGSGHKKTYETIWDACTQLSTDRTVIYHPNGFLPSSLLENPSDHLVFAEDSFADQLIESMAGHYSSLLHYLFKNTCLFIGVSLVDSTLKHLLRQNARVNPGHYHYNVAFVADGEAVDNDRRAAVTAANFEVYNLITLFLTSTQIAALGRLLTLNATDFANIADESGAKSKFCYYICGAVGAGKTTTLSYFRSLSTHDEWLETRPQLLAKPWVELSDDERLQVDDWISDQFGRKNLNLLQSPPGIHIVDRSPIDPIAFTPSGQWCAKADNIISKVSPGASKRGVQNGQVILLENDPKDLQMRNSNRHRGGDEDYLGLQQTILDHLYSHAALTRVDVRGLSVHQVVKRVAHVIHIGDYMESDLQALLTNISSGTVKPLTATH